jgi:hypothetical protein
LRGAAGNHRLLDRRGELLEEPAFAALGLEMEYAALRFWRSLTDGEGAEAAAGTGSAEDGRPG